MILRTHLYPYYFLLISLLFPYKGDCFSMEINKKLKVLFLHDNIAVAEWLCRLTYTSLMLFASSLKFLCMITCYCRDG